MKLSSGQICSAVRWEDDLPSGVCYQYDKESDRIYLRECDDGLKCSNEHSISLSSVEIDTATHYWVDENSVQGQKYDGESCLASAECASGICSAGLCIGKGDGSSCTSTGECGLQLTCRENSCVPQSNPGEVCSQEDHCVNDSGCYNNVCAKYFTLANGTRFTGTLNNYVCSSGYASSKQGACSEGPESRNEVGDSCTSSSQCDVDGDLTQGYWYCGLTDDGNAYCGALQGDDEYIDFIQAFKDVMQINRLCHSKISYSRRCPQLSGTAQVKELERTFYSHYYRHKLVNVPSCVLDVLFPSVSDTFEDSGSGDSEDDSSESSTSSSSLGTIGIVVIIVVIVAILVLGVATYFVIRKCKMGENTRVNNNVGPRDVQPSSIIYMPNSSNVTRNRYEVTDIPDDAKLGKEPIKGIPVGAPTDAHTLHIIENQEPEFVLAEVAEDDESDVCESRNGDMAVTDMDQTNLSPPSTQFNRNIRPSDY